MKSKLLLAVLSLAFAGQAFAAAPYVYQSKMVSAMLNDAKFIDAMEHSKSGAFESIQISNGFDVTVAGKYVDYHELNSPTYGKTFVCTHLVKMKITNGDDWDPEYGVDNVGEESCKLAQ